MKRLYLILLPCCALTLLALSSCSETKNLAEDETLYVGIKQLAYDKYIPKDVSSSNDQEGVITAVARAYDTVSSYLQGSGDADSSDGQKEKLDKALKDSLAALQKQDRDAYSLAKSEVNGVLSKSPNNSLMGSSYYRFPLPLGLWIYNKYVYLDSRWARWMLNTFAATPVYVTSVNPRVRVQVAENTLRNYGYFRGTASYTTIGQKNPKKAKISYEVHPGDLFRLDTIQYQLFSPSADALVQGSMAQSLLHQGDPFSVVNLDGERTRLSNLFRDNGYYYYQSSYITFRADTLMRPQYVQLQIRPSTDMPPAADRQYYIGKTRVNIYSNDAYELTDTIDRGNLSMAYTRVKGGVPLKLKAFFFYLRYHNGDLYSQTVQQKVQSYLGDMGLFSMLNMQYVPRDTLPDCDTLDVIINARLDKPYDAEFTGNVASKSNGLIGPGATFSMSRQNAFRGGEKVSLDLKGSYEWQTGAHVQGGSGQVINSYEYGVGLNLQFPRLTILTLGQKLSRHAKTSTTYKIEANWQNRSNYFGQVTFGARIVYSYQRRATIKHEFVPFRLDYNMLMHTTARFDSIVDRNPALYVSMRNQFVPSMQYTLSMSSRATARNPRTFTLTVKEAGNITSGIYRVFGQSLKQDGKHLFGVPFAQYLKITGEYTNQFRMGSTRTYLAGRIFAGAILSYGNSTMAPYSDLFSVGGANSIRAFGVRSIGPGSYNPGTSSYSYIDELGDLKLEANLEYRFPLVAQLYGALFVDAGNVWLLKPDEARPGGSFNIKTFGKELALGTGFGLRYDLDFLVIRFDIGVGIHSPYDTGVSGYYNMTRFGKSLGYHLAVGYPF
ncbi:MAG: BamA/TamA family outer membrane protein [Prevotellaceae bacterium]|nr:BamA/TamA family outer membrane protein [Prevotellaceae bacterium]